MALFPIVNDAVQLSTDAPGVADQFRYGIRIKSDNSVAYAATGAVSQAQNGLGLDSNGSVICVDATSALPVGTVYVNGLPISPLGELCVSTAPVDEWSNGLPMSANGALCAVGMVTTDFAVWNTADKNSDITVSGGDLIATKINTNSWVSLRANQFKSIGSWMFEIQVNLNDAIVGFGNASFSLASYVGATATSLGFAAHINSYFSNGITAGAAPSGGVAVYSFALDLTNGKGWIAQNGIWIGNPSAGTSPSFTWAGGTLSLTPAASVYGYVPASQVTLNCGQNTFAAAVPTGFNAGWYL